MGTISWSYSRQCRTPLTTLNLPFNDFLMKHQVNEARSTVKQADATIGAKVKEADGKLHQLASEGKSQFGQARKDATQELKETADKFDETVERKTKEAKSGISSWLGFGK